MRVLMTCSAPALVSFRFADNTSGTSRPFDRDSARSAKCPQPVLVLCFRLSPTTPFIRIALKKQLLKQRDQSLTIANTRDVGLEQWVSPYRLFDSEELNELLPQRIGGNSNNEVTLTAFASHGASRRYIRGLAPDIIVTADGPEHVAKPLAALEYWRRCFQWIGAMSSGFQVLSK